MKTIAKIFFIGQIVASVLFCVCFGFYTLRGIFMGEHIFVIVCFAAIVAVCYRMMLLPSIAEYKEHKAKHGK